MGKDAGVRLTRIKSVAHGHAGISTLDRVPGEEIDTTGGQDERDSPVLPGNA